MGYIIVSDFRPVCSKCMARMHCIKNGETIVYSMVAYQDGDRFQCPTCGNEIITGFGEPYTKGDINELGYKGNNDASPEENLGKD